MRTVDIIRKKRDGKKLSEEEIASIIKGAVTGDTPDYQLTAFLMAVYFRGMDLEETALFTKYMMESGTVIDLSEIEGPKIDKHSTGGVGDKISLVLAPLVASAGVKVPMISGRSLGHTGGTLDKLESIPGFRTSLTQEEFVESVKKIGVAIAGQTEDLVPADRKLYSLRDATATVDSIPLIASSIMSKKLAEGIDGLVLDVKTGSGAFMRRFDDAEQLAETLMSIGKSMGKKMFALITDMNQPLGRAVGNALEVVESIDVLRGEGPEDVRELSLILGSYMLILAGLSPKLSEARKILEDALSTGKAYEKWVEMVKNQGGDPDAPLADDFIQVKIIEEVHSTEEGYLAHYDTYKIGTAAALLGAGRARVEDVIDPKVGIYVLKKIGDKVEKGAPLFEIRGNEESRVKEAKALLEECYTVWKERTEPRDLVLRVMR